MRSKTNNSTTINSKKINCTKINSTKINSATMTLVKSMLFILMAMPAILQAHEYFHWEKGDQATYTGNVNQLAVTSAAIKQSGQWVFVSDFAGLGDQWVYGGPAKGIYLYKHGTYQKIPDHTFAVGSQTSVSLGACHDDVTVTLNAKNLSIDTPAAQFKNVIELAISGSVCRDAGVTKIWFAQGVGVVQWQTTTVQGSESYSLLRARVGTDEYPAKQGINVSGNLPAPQLKHTPGMTLKASLAVTNHTKADLNLAFSTPRKLDMVLIDNSGNEVQRLSNDIGPELTVIVVDQLASGKTNHYHAEMVLSDTIPAGDYALRVELNTWGPATAVIAPISLQ